MKAIMIFCKEWLNLYTCGRCHFELRVLIAEHHDCPACGEEMRYDGVVEV